MPERDANQLAADVRAYIEDDGHGEQGPALTALDALVARITDLELAVEQREIGYRQALDRITDLEAQLADAAEHLGDLVQFGEATARARAAEAQVAALTRQIELADEDEDIASRHNLARAEAAEAEVERLTEALRGIASQEPDEDDVQDADPEFVLTHPRVFSGAQVARAVLAGRKDTPQ